MVAHLNFGEETSEEAGIDSEILREIDSEIESHVYKGIIPGAVVLVARDGIIVKNSSYGYRQKYDKGIPLKKPLLMKKDTIFDLASVTKVMATTQAVMRLISQGRLGLQDKVIKFIPEFGQKDKDKITIAELLTHTSGLPEWKPTYCHVSNREEELRYVCQVSLKYKTGKERRYSDFGFMVLGFIVEKITEKRLDIYLNEEIYSKLGMKDTMFNPKNSLKGRIAATSWGNPFERKMISSGIPYPCEERVEDFKGWRDYTLIGEANDGNCYYSNDGVAGHAGLFSTAYDLAILGQVMLNRGEYGGLTLYNKDILYEFINPQKFKNGYGFEINRKEYMGQNCLPQTFGHSGFTGTHIVIDPIRRLQIIILTNKQNNGLTADDQYMSTFPLCRRVCDIVYSSLGN